MVTLDPTFDKHVAQAVAVGSVASVQVRDNALELLRKYNPMYLWDKSKEVHNVCT